ncbi:uncharacterized protein LY89DRAFT_651393 [Mollisia scopiformis]|uniref:Glutamyl-tRNA amidotransferase complex subunit Gta3 domain-containing protein n=1 Tax=Mollisia scopiformis TaxID=149040 RepID=A0A194WZ98_MOLSC|nr:uncharacterized protein LY89DRAFT_651393 [Mollisia scopiformis]KUJ13275.1 hypothetical protein LY89DRAFT_651393 [Mollisia scopiformis]
MSGYICRSCRISLRRTLRSPRFRSIPTARTHTTDSLFEEDGMRAMGAAAEFKEDGKSRNDDQEQDRELQSSKKQLLDVEALLSKPTWSVRSLIPDDNVLPEDEITPEKLHHLLRLSALPLPKSSAEEAKMLKILHSQLHFVRDIQKVNTDGVEPLRSIRDETEEGIKEITIGMEQLKEAFAKEDIVGKNRRPRRRRDIKVDTKGVEDWNVMGSAAETVEMNGSRYFVVRSGKGQAEKSRLNPAEWRSIMHENAGEVEDLPEGSDMSAETGSKDAHVLDQELKS